MNIFVSSPNADESAQALDDRRLVKMVLETTQMISTVRYKQGLYAPYRPTHQNHPCVLWLDDPLALNWLSLHLLHLGMEYMIRYDKLHASFEVIQNHLVFDINLPPPEKFVNCARNAQRGWDFTGEADIHLAYRKYLTIKWDNDKHSPRWTFRSPPYWYERNLHEHD